MTAAGADVGLMQLLHLPPVEAEVEQVTPGRQGGPAVAVMGAVLAVIGVFLGLARPDATLAWTGVALTGLGSVEIVVGMVLLPLGRLDRQSPVREIQENRLLTERRPQGQGGSRIFKSSRKSVIM